MNGFVGFGWHSPATTLTCFVEETYLPQTILEPIWGFPKIRGYLFWDPYDKDYSILGAILGYPALGKLPYGLL